MSTTYFSQADGRQVDERVATDEHGVLKTGFWMRTRHTTRDDQVVRDDLRNQHIEKYNARVSNAWRGPQEPKPNVPSKVSGDDPYDAYERRVSAAWQHR